MSKHRNRTVVSLNLTPQEHAFFQNMARSINKSKAAALRLAITDFIARHERKIEERKQVEIVEELNGFRTATWVALRQLSFISAQNLHLVSTIFTDALPAELSGLSEEQWGKLWEESRDWAKKYLELLDKNLRTHS